ncbi:hypothetical protein JG676_06090 [Campylobacter sp. 2018MI35]|uniref:tetratricopeptide repeat protein n=1 Tax=Campylobacter sp. 2018MI34 TaxID=2800582 RepID=UPI00190798A4|nr:hypothetical protein [Campylobacter sp. 2018MI34]MBK1992169.1 hypothetical protein [Campylobacter sp. 2018MI34]
MDLFFLDYRDPLVGLIFITILIFIIALLNYFWRFFAYKDEEEKLEKFIKKFELNNVHKDLLKDPNLSLANLIFLASIFTRSGEFEKAIQIYLIALEKVKDKKEQEDIFISLAEVYFKAGFLERSKEVLLNALKIRPRNEKALKLLKIVYLRLRSYKEVLDTLECLLELDEEVKEEKEFIKALMIKEQDIDQKSKIELILNLDIKDNIMLQRLIFENYQIIKDQNLFDIIDLIYRDKKIVKIDKQEYKEFFYALNLLPKEEKFFLKNQNFRMFKILNDNDFKVKMVFSYVCLECKNAMPLFFYHCPICYGFNKCKILYEVKLDETN